MAVEGGSCSDAIGGYPNADWDCAGGALVVLVAGHVPGRWATDVVDMVHIVSKGIVFQYNYRHFNKHALPGWTEQDTLIGERMDGLADILRSLVVTDDSVPTS